MSNTVCMQNQNNMLFQWNILTHDISRRHFRLHLRLIVNVINFSIRFSANGHTDKKQAPARIIGTWLSLAGKKVDLIR